MRFIRYLSLNGLLFGLLWFGLVEHVQGALNVGLFFVWVLSAASLSFLTEPVVVSTSRKGFSAPYWFDVTFDLTIIGLLVWYGCLWSAGAYLFHMIMICALREKVKELNNAINK